MQHAHTFPAQTTAWQDTPEARTVLDRLTPADFHLRRSRDIHPDRMELHGEALADLAAVRAAHAATVAGGTFLELEARHGRDGALFFISCMGDTPEAVIAAMFGPPHVGMNRTDDDATRLWQALAARAVA